MFQVEQTLLSAVKQMVQDGEKRKQYLGFMLASVLLDSQLGTLGPNTDFFNKTILNPLLQSMSTCLKKNEVLRSDQGAAALKAVMPILTLVYRHFDQKTHQASVEHIKQIMTLLLRKLEVFVEQPGDLSVQSTNVQVLLAVKTIQKGLVLFPNCFSQAI